MHHICLIYFLILIFCLCEHSRWLVIGFKDEYVWVQTYGKEERRGSDIIIGDYHLQMHDIGTLMTRKEPVFRLATAAI